MQVVVNVTKELYDEIKNGIYDSNTRNMTIAIGNGIILPPGHGDLIDRSKIAFDYWSVDNYVCVGKRNIFEMPVIVPAEKE